MRARRREADLEHVARAAPRMQHGAPAALAMRVDQVVDRRVEPGLRERVDDEIALPGAVALAAPVLQRAAAADAEMRADRRDPLRARASRPAAGGGGRDGPATASTSTVSPGSA